MPCHAFVVGYPFQVFIGNLGLRIRLEQFEQAADHLLHARGFTAAHFQCCTFGRSATSPDAEIPLNRTLVMQAEAVNS
jgi:hypothetical protein